MSDLDDKCFLIVALESKIGAVHKAARPFAPLPIHVLENAMSITNSTLDAARLRYLLDYRPEDGLFVRKVSLSNRVKVGDLIAGSPNNMGYLRICVDRRSYLSHRLAWLHVFGVWPSDLIDHKNGIPADNRIDNLREATYSENQCNKSNSSCFAESGLLGVFKTNRPNRWYSLIKINGTYRYLGYFKDKQLAHEAYLAAKRTDHAYCMI